MIEPSGPDLHEREARQPEPQAAPKPQTDEERLFAETEILAQVSTTASLPDAERSAGQRLRLAGEIARGGMGVVLRGCDDEIGREVAVKVLLPKHAENPEYLSRFAEEAQICGQLQHPGIVPVYEIGRLPDRRPYFTMKLISGRTLAALLAARSGLEAERSRFLKIFEQVCQAVGYAHSRGVIHRDLKPSNIMVGAFGEIQVMDWGLAKVLARGPARPEAPQVTAHAGDSASVADEPPPSPSVRTRRSTGDDTSDAGHQLTGEGSALGTPAYMAPEQAAGALDRLDERCDVFGLGAILCHILSGRPPYVGTDGKDVLSKAVRAELDEARAQLDSCGADRQLIELARWCLSPEPAERPRHAGEVAAEMTEYLESVDIRLRRAEVERTAAVIRATEERKRRRLTTILAGTILGGVVLAVGAGLVVERERLRRETATAAERLKTTQDLQEMLRQAEVEHTRARLGNDSDAWSRARVLAGRAETLAQSGRVDEEWTARVGALVLVLEREQAERELLERLERARLTQAQPDLRELRFQREAALAEYADAFASFGVSVGKTAPQQLAARLAGAAPAVRSSVSAALGDWLLLAGETGLPEAAWLGRVIDRIDGDDSVRSRLRQALIAQDSRVLDSFAADPDVLRQPPQTINLLGAALIHADPARAAELLARGRERHPGDFWLNFQLALAGESCRPPRHDQAVQFCTAALALRPENTAVLNQLGYSLRQAGRLGESVAAHRRVVESAPEFAEGYFGLGKALAAQGNFDEAIGVLRRCVELKPEFAAGHGELAATLAKRLRFGEALAEYHLSCELDPDLAASHVGLGSVLGSLGRFAEALVELRRSTELAPDDPEAWYNLGVALYATGRQEEALAAFRRTFALNPADVRASANMAAVLRALGRLDEAESVLRRAAQTFPNNPGIAAELAVVLRQNGRFAESLVQFQHGIELAASQPLLQAGFQQFLRDAVRLAAMDSKLVQFAVGRFEPEDNDDRLALAEVCSRRGRPRSAAALYEQAFAADGKLADDLQRNLRYDAACQAILAGAGIGEDSLSPDDPQRAAWRKKAFDWLQADLSAWKQRWTAAGPREKPFVLQTLQHWQRDPDLKSVRDAPEIDSLPRTEQDEWRAFWNNVNAVSNQPEAAN
jgi:eukaryotic-like serine/threonine-protein kinase